MDKIELEILALSHSVSQNDSFAVVLREKNGNKRVPIVIGGFEAQAIAVALENLQPGRPLTHDLVLNMFQTFGIELKEVLINNLADGIFYAQLICQQGDDIFEIDSRTSDAIALAVRFNCPIFSYGFIIEAAGITIEEDDDGEPQLKDIKIKEEVQQTQEDGYKSYSTEELQEMLKAAIERENYEKAAKIRDELDKR